jgi:hypothetical protein
MQIPLEVVGIICNSDKPGHRVLISSDAEDTGGLFVYEWWAGSTGPNADHAFDSWVSNRDELHKFFEESGWYVQWPA